MPRSSSAIASGSSSRTETSWPLAIMLRAIADPTRPQPTIRMNTLSMYSRSDALARPFLAQRRSGQDHAARRLLDHVTRGLPNRAVARSAATAQAPSAAHPGRLLRREHDRLDPAP